MNKKNKTINKLAVWGVLVAFVAVFLCVSVQSTAFADAWWYSETATDSDWAINILFNAYDLEMGINTPLVCPLLFDSSNYTDNNDIYQRYMNVLYSYFFTIYRNLDHRTIFFNDHTGGDLGGDNWRQGQIYINYFRYNIENNRYNENTAEPIPVNWTVSDFSNYLRYGVYSQFYLNFYIKDNYDVLWYFDTVSIRFEYIYNTFNLINVYGQADRYDEGYDDGYDTGYDEGYDDGYYTGNIVGYNNGFTDGRNENLTGFEVARKIFDSVRGIMDIPILGFITLGGLLGMAVLMGIVVFIVGLIKR